MSRLFFFSLIFSHYLFLALFHLYCVSFFFFLFLYSFDIYCLGLVWHRAQRSLPSCCSWTRSILEWSIETRLLIITRLLAPNCYFLHFTARLITFTLSSTSIYCLIFSRPITKTLADCFAFPTLSFSPLLLLILFCWCS